VPDKLLLTSQILISGSQPTIPTTIYEHIFIKFRKSTRLLFSEVSPDKRSPFLFAGINPSNTDIRRLTEEEQASALDPQE
jgi:hypothetical protein